MIVCNYLLYCYFKKIKIMKKIFYIFIVALIITSCSSDPTKLDVNNLEEPCDFVDALTDIHNEMNVLFDKNQNKEKIDWEEKDKEKYQKLKDKRYELKGRLKDVYKGRDYRSVVNKEFSECGGYSEYVENRGTRCF